MNPSKHVQVPFPVQTPPLEHGVEQPLACTSMMLTPPLPLPPSSSPTSAIESHTTSRDDLSFASWTTAHVLDVRRRDFAEEGYEAVELEAAEGRERCAAAPWYNAEA